MSKFKVGDKVVVGPLLKEEGPFWSELVHGLAGKKGQIEFICGGWHAIQGIAPLFTEHQLTKINTFKGNV